MQRYINTFTIIFVLAAVFSIAQLGALGNGITMTFAEYINPTPTIVPTQVPTPSPTQPAMPANTFKPERITIADVDIDLLVFSQPDKGGSRDVLPHVANFAEGTSLVNPDRGNVGFFANDKLIGFTRIQQLTYGSEIAVYGNHQKAVYTVVSSSAIEDENADVFAQSAEPMLTLVTVDGDFSQKLYMVQAVLEKIELDTN